jgi:uncharacterized membrane protein YeaQ/YmgE (transglycosylase-associated protein family)
MARKRTTTRRKSTTPVRRRRVTAKAPVRRRRSTAKKGLLSEMFNPAMAQGAFKTLISGAAGGLGAGLLGKVLPTTTSPEMRAGYTLVAGFVTSTVLKLPNVGAGMAAVAVKELLTVKGLLSEDMNYANSMDSLPMVLNEGEAMYLAEQNGMYLAEEDYNYNVGYYPAGFGGM